MFDFNRSHHINQGIQAGSFFRLQQLRRSHAIHDLVDHGRQAWAGCGGRVLGRTGCVLLGHAGLVGCDAGQLGLVGHTLRVQGGFLHHAACQVAHRVVAQRQVIHGHRSRWG